MLWTFLTLILGLALAAHGGTTEATSDPCAGIAGQSFVVPGDALACLKSFPFNETLRQNVLTVISRVFDFYTFEDYYLNSPPPFQESTTNIRADIARINSTSYATDYDFNRAVYDFTNQLNDGHTRWLTDCYGTFENLLPAPIVTLQENGAEGVYIIPDLAQLIPLVGTEFTDYYASIGFNWERLAGARVLQIEGQDPYAYVDYIADTASGNYLDHGVRVNSVFSSYRIADTSFSQRFGDLAGTSFPDQESLTFNLILANSTLPETVTVPFLAIYAGNNFTDSASYWGNNCAANNATNGVDLLASSGLKEREERTRRLARAVIVDKSQTSAVGLPDPYLPTAPPVNGSTGVIKSFVLPDNKTGVMFVGSFEGDYVQFQTDTQAAVAAFQAANVTRLLVDLTNNGGGYVCLGEFLHSYLAGSNFGYTGFQSSSRANPLAVKIVQADIAKGITANISYYAPDNCKSRAFLNDTEMPEGYDYNDPSVSLFINGQQDADSQRFHDLCTPYNVDLPENPPFDLRYAPFLHPVNGNCASTCSMFSTSMFERHGTKIAVFGGKPGEIMEYKGMAGNQVLEWSDIDTEIKTAGLKNDPLAPPDLLVSGDFRHNWRTAWSYFDESRPIAYVSEPAPCKLCSARAELDGSLITIALDRYPYTKDTYMNPQNLWTFA
ncbi:hypothetical protein GLOTRDRAFT_47956 [Gloeophyllum trabeum ATCC 11539]|uniref:Tail specific protease domain-containing protein n=1 Tax=Gloeophyllum trabeum (strain ATCC 11539 / FP-39264 / Madison 617) TaxID=670483 RepID=S7PWI0_GLOTA|nr:uncharacterized protein GLOTRDRAFT_47956 [Gloeophyllum trabeum ATCC 11539]EPQ51893.1 hypothetical protein GLOTRDRAFT_47956 [Gloeophyllum trabeum ATCC 11539]